MLKMEVNKDNVSATMNGRMLDILVELTLGINAIYNSMPTPDAKEIFRRTLIAGIVAPGSPAFKEIAATDPRVKKTTTVIDDPLGLFG